MAGGTFGAELVNAQTGTTYALATTDIGKLVTFNNAAAVAVTLAQAGASGLFQNGDWIDVLNLGGGPVTITTTTSTIGGAATLVLAQGEGGRIISDATSAATGNYQVSAGGAGGSSQGGIITAPVTDAVDFLTVTPGATGTPGLVKLQSTGTDTNIGFLLGSKGSGVVALGGTTVANASAQVTTVTSSVNFLQLAGAATGVAPTLTATGADTNIGLSLLAKGTTNASLATLGAFNTGSGASGQTLSVQRGIITTNSLSTAAATAVTYSVTNTFVASTSLILLTNQAYSGTYVTNGYPVLMQAAPGSGSFIVTIVNTHAANALAGTLAIGFVIMN